MWEIGMSLSPHGYFFHIICVWPCVKSCTLPSIVQKNDSCFAKWITALDSKTKLIYYHPIKSGCFIEWLTLVWIKTTHNNRIDKSLYFSFILLDGLPIYLLEKCREYAWNQGRHEVLKLGVHDTNELRKKATSSAAPGNAATQCSNWFKLLKYVLMRM